MTNPPPSPRIAYLTSEYPAVSHTFILREVEALRALGLDVMTASVRRTPPEHHRGPAEKEAARTTFYVLSAARSPLTLVAAVLAALRTPGRLLRTVRLAIKTSPPGLRALLWQVFYLVEAMILARHMRAEGVTHLHNHFAGPSASVAMLTSELSDIPFSFTLHGPADLYEPRYWAVAEKIAGAQFVACISHYARSQCMLLSEPVHWPKLAIVHCGVIPEIYEAPEPREHEGLRLLFVGRLAAVKGLRVLIAALAGAHAPGLRLTLIGDGPDRAALEREAAPMGDAVRFAGYRSQAEVAAALAEADALVLPSFAEGVPVVLMEAMAAGRAVIATRITGVPELVEDGVSGLLVPPGDVGSLTRAIERLAGDLDLRRQMGAAGRDRVRAEFDVRREAERLRALFLGKQPAARR